jgi:hypothetical protein
MRTSPIRASNLYTANRIGKKDYPQQAGLLHGKRQINQTDLFRQLFMRK